MLETIKNLPNPLTSAKFWIISLCCIVLPLFFGASAVVLPWFIFLGLTLLPISFGLATTYPHAGMVICLALIFEAIPAALTPSLPFGGGSLKVYDLLIIYLTAVVAIRKIISGGGIIGELGSFAPPLLYLLTFVSLSLVYAKFVAHNQLWLTEGRIFIAWLLLPLIILSTDSKSRLNHLIYSSVAISLAVSIYVILQSFLDIKIMSIARVEAMGSGDVNRSIAGGAIYVIIFSIYLCINGLIDRKLNPAIGLPLLAVFLLALAVQFGRGVWIGAACGFLLASYISRGIRGVIVSCIVSSILIGIMLGALSVTKPEMTEALIDRATGISEEVRSGGSFNWRFLEADAAFTAIRERPITGVGIGGEYKKTISSKGSFGIETSYIHNAYIYYPLKMGIFAALIPLSFIIAFARTAYLTLRNPAANNWVFSALVGAFSVPVITSGTQPEWVNPQGIAALALLMALTAIHHNTAQQEEARK